MPDGTRPSLPLRQDTLRGIATIATGFATISAADAAVKWALPEVGVAVAMIWRGVFGMIAIAMLVRGRGLLPRRVPLIVTRSMLHCLVTVSFYVAWMNGFPLADSYAVNAVAPLMMTLLAIPILGEKVGWRRMTSICVGFGGVLIMLQPGGEMWRWEAAMILAGTCVLAVTRIWTRVLAATDTPQAIAFGLLFAHVPVGLLLLPVFPPPGDLVPSAGAAVALGFLGLANGFSHYLFARAFAIAPVSALAPYEYTTILWGVLLGFLLWGEVPAWVTLAGATLVIVAGLYNLRRERLRRTERGGDAPALRGGEAAPATAGVNRPHGPQGHADASDRLRAEAPQASSTEGVNRPHGPQGHADASDRLRAEAPQVSSTEGVNRPHGPQGRR